VLVNVANSPALGFRAVQVRSKIVGTAVVRRFMMFAPSKTMKQGSARGTFALIVGMYANHQRRMMKAALGKVDPLVYE
jgi:hypothetical protein